LYVPVSFVTAVFTIPVPVFVAFTETPGINAPDASETVPPSTAFVVWANVLIEKARHRSIATAKISLFTCTPLFNPLTEKIDLT
jgi:hypothetical protein